MGLPPTYGDNPGCRCCAGAPFFPTGGVGALHRRLREGGRRAKGNRRRKTGDGAGGKAEPGSQEGQGREGMAAALPGFAGQRRPEDTGTCREGSLVPTAAPARAGGVVPKLG